MSATSSRPHLVVAHLKLKETTLKTARECGEDVVSTTSSDSGHHSTFSSIKHYNEVSSLDTPSSTCWNSAELRPSEANLEAQPLMTQDGEEEEICRQSWVKMPLSRSHLMASKASLTSTASALLCRICHTEATSYKDPFVSPCRCSGSLLHVHRSCLVHWLELSTRKMVPAPRCELCGYNYKRAHFLPFNSIHFPRVNSRDRILNALFVVVFIIMLICAGLSIHFLRLSEMQHTSLRGYRVVSAHLSEEDVTVVVCSVLFFAAFFVAVFTQYRADASIFRLCFRCWVINRNWTIRNYQLGDDPEMQHLRAQRDAARNASNLASQANVKNPPSDLLIHQKNIKTVQVV